MKLDFLPDISDCGEIHRSGVHTNGVFTISPDGRCPFNVYCDMTNGGWTIVQKRDGGSENFYRSWDDYVAGFGDISGEHWLGLDKIHRLTQSGYEILFDMDNYDGTKEFANYKSFIVNGASVVYKCGFWGSLFTPFFTPSDHFFQTRTTFQNLLNILKKTHLDISYNPFII